MSLMERIRTILIVVVLIGIGISAYFTLAPLLEPQATNSPTLPQVIPPQETNQESSLAEPPPNSDEAWIKYECVPLSFTIMHPQELPPEKRGETIVFAKWGPSQRENTGFYDGISLVLDDGGYEGSFSTFVQSELDQMKEWPTFESATPLEAVAVAGREAWKFKVVSMVESTYIYIKKENNHFFRITDNTQDPTNQGFAQVVQRMIESLELN